LNSETTKSQSEELPIIQNGAVEIIEEFKYITSTLQKCIEEVMTNDLIIKRIQAIMGNLYPCYSN
jgi:hypothetical protein